MDEQQKQNIELQKKSFLTPELYQSRAYIDLLQNQQNLSQKEIQQQEKNQYQQNQQEIKREQQNTNQLKTKLEPSENYQDFILSTSQKRITKEKLKLQHKEKYLLNEELWNYDYIENQDIQNLNNNNNNKNNLINQKKNENFIILDEEDENFNIGYKNINFEDSDDFNSEDEANLKKFGIISISSNSSSRSLTPTKLQSPLIDKYKQNDNFYFSDQKVKEQEINQKNNQNNQNKMQIEDDSQSINQNRSQSPIKIQNNNSKILVKKNENVVFLESIDEEDSDCQILESQNQNVQKVQKKVNIFDSENKKRYTIFEGIQKPIQNQNRNNQIDLESDDYEQQIQEQKQIKQFNNEVKNIKPVNLQGFKKREQIVEKNADKFQCFQGTSGKKENLNQNITDELEKLHKVYQSQKDEQWRVFAYRKAISIIKNLDFKIKNKNDIKHIQGLGDKILKKVQEILDTGELQKAKNMTGEEKYKVTQQFIKIWGVGESKAEQLYNQGMRSITQLRRHQYLLSKNQIIGLKYYDELQDRMPREEAKKISDLVTERVRKIENKNNIFEVMTCGSYRRGKETCGDVDILLCRKDGNVQKNFMVELIDELTNIEPKILTDHLQLPKSNHGESETYMGICLVDRIHRRIDIKLFPRQSYGFAVLYFTGSDLFNRSMRLYARKKGLSLSSSGISYTQRTNKEKVWQGESIACFTEEEVFKFLGVPYKEPSERSL